MGVLLFVGLAVVAVAVLLVLPRLVRRRILDPGEVNGPPGDRAAERLIAKGNVVMLGWDTEPGVFTAVAGLEGEADPVVLRMWPASGSARRHDLTHLGNYLDAMHGQVVAAGHQPELWSPPSLDEQAGPWLAKAASRRWPPA